MRRYGGVAQNVEAPSVSIKDTVIVVVSLSVTGHDYC
jgi:hypothetical protein